MKTFLLQIPKGVPSLIALAGVLFFSLSENPLGLNALTDITGAEEFGHFFMYFLSSLIMILDYAKARLPHHTKINVELAICAANSTLALLMEMAQLFIGDGTNFDFMNWFCAIAGSFLACYIHRKFIMHPFRHYLYHSLQHHWRYKGGSKK